MCKQYCIFYFLLSYPIVRLELAHDDLILYKACRYFDLLNVKLIARADL